MPAGVRVIPRIKVVLDNWVEGPAILVVDAPTGYGKTTQLASWVATRPDAEAVIWISGSTFFTSWEDAWNGLVQGLADLGVIDDAARAQVSTRAELFVVLHRLERRVILVIDEADRLHPFADLDRLEREAGRFPRLRTIVVTSRPMPSDPAIAMTEREHITHAQLGWSEHDALDVLTARGIEVLALPIRRLVEATGGRASAILSYGPTVSGGAGGTSRELRQRWFSERVSHVVDPARATQILNALSDFIEAPSVLLPELDIQPDEPAFVELEREGLIEAITLPGSAEPSGYRMSPEDRLSLDNLGPRVPIDAAVHENAARHFESIGRRGSAIFHLSHLQRYGEALDLLRRPLSGHDATVGLDDLRDALHLVPADVLRADPEALALRLLLSHFPPLEPAKSRAALEATLLSLPRRTIDALPLAARVVVTTAAVGALTSRGRSAEASAMGRGLANELLTMPWSAVHEISRQAGLLWTAQAEAEMLEGRVRLASGFARAALQAADDGAHVYGRFMIEATASAIAAIEGDFPQSARHVRDAELHYSLGNWPASTKLYPISIARMFTAQWTMDTDALFQVAARFRDVPDRSDPWWAAGEIAEAYALLFSSKPTQALSKVRGVMRLADSRSVSRLLRSMVLAANADILNVLGRPGAALAVLDGVPETDEHAICLGARRATSRIHSGDFRGALLATEACVELGHRHTPRSLVSSLVRRAVAQDQLGSTRAADATFVDALSQLPSAPTPFFGLNPEYVAPLWDRVDEDHRSLRASVEALSPASARNASRPVVGALSNREIDVLRLIRAGNSIPEMSEALFLSANTVKTHLRTLYRKLGATNRREAVDIADALGFGTGPRAS